MFLAVQLDNLFEIAIIRLVPPASTLGMELSIQFFLIEPIIDSFHFSDTLFS